MKNIWAIIAVSALSPLGGLAHPATNAVYVNYFSGTTAPGRYLRYLHTITAAARMAHPTQPGRQAMQLTICFEPTQLKADLFWDLSPISCNRVRFRVWNPNAQKLPIYLNVAMNDADHRGYFLAPFRQQARPGTPLRPRSAYAADPLPTSAVTGNDGGWITYEARLPADIVSLGPQGETRPTDAELRTRAFSHLSMSFHVRNNFPALGRPLTLIVEGLELYLDAR
ncbi:MAG: hypothetical protein EPN23_07775 [Verrucomicrobia bacterium]|nr:MAG: hypothetical protein EPN23_07775 [Verrucomicrobiota bacterium]